MADVERGGAAVNLGLVDVVFLGCGRDLGFGRNCVLRALFPDYNCSEL